MNFISIHDIRIHVEKCLIITFIPLIPCIKQREGYDVERCHMIKSRKVFSSPGVLFMAGSRKNKKKIELRNVENIVHMSEMRG